MSIDRDKTNERETRLDDLMEGYRRENGAHPDDSNREKQMKDDESAREDTEAR